MPVGEGMNMPLLSYFRSRKSKEKNLVDQTPESSTGNRSASIVSSIGWEYRELGDKARDTRDWATAVNCYHAYLATNKEDFAIWVQLGHALKELGRYEDSYSAYISAEHLNPNDADLLLNMGRLLMEMKNFSAALRCLERSESIDNNVHAKNLSALILGELSNTKLQKLDLYNIDEKMQKVLLSGFFDPIWYLERYPDLDIRVTGTLEHFMAHGAYEWRSPGPRFDTEWYLSQNPDLAQAVNSRLLNPLLHYIEFGIAEGRKAVPPTNTYIRTTSNVIKDIIDLDPQLYSKNTFVNPKTLRAMSAIPSSKHIQVFCQLFSKLQQTYDYIITVPWLIHGGAELMAMHFARALTEKLGSHSVLVVAVDFPNDDAKDWIPAGVDVIQLQNFGVILETEQTVECLLNLITAVKPKAIINVNSLACWELIRQFGHALHDVQLYACAFCRDYNSSGYPAGYADTHVRECIYKLTGLLSDNKLFFDTIANHFNLPVSMKSKMVTFYNPAPLPRVTARLSDVDSEASEQQRQSNDKQGATKQFTVLWASRFTEQKNIKLLEKVVMQLPFVAFEIWGRGHLDYVLKDLANKSENVNIRGPYNNFNQLPLESYDAFLYTTLWDGIPNVLLEAAANNIPIVTSNVGGIRELVDSSTGWLIDSLDNPIPYAQALREIMSDPRNVAKKQANMQVRLSEQHQWAQFVNRLAALLGE
jgi:glycosyltransferase involved in cell wall biosynthesis